MTLDHYKRLALERLGQLGDRNIYPVESKDLMHINRCPICGYPKLEPITQVYLFNGLNFFSTTTCLSCFFTFRTVSPGFRWFQKCWDMIKSDKLEVFNKKAEVFKRKRHLVYRRLLNTYRQSGSFLEIGGGYGAGSKLFKDAGFDVEVIESEPNKTLFIQKKLGIPVVDDSIEHFLATTTRTYDVILFSNCLEHLDDPVVVVAELPKILKPGGVLLIAIPIIWDSITWSDALYLTHKSNFTVENFNVLLARYGWETIEMLRVPLFFDNIWENCWLLRKQGNSVNLSCTYRDPEKVLRDVKALYRTGLDPTIRISPEGVLKFHVPHVDQFFQTINLDRYDMGNPEEDVIVFTPKI